MGFCKKNNKDCSDGCPDGWCWRESLDNSSKSIAYLMNTEINKIEIVHEWQCCPRCGGDGIVANYSITTSGNTTRQCNICRGEGIISKVSGLPPSKQNILATTQREMMEYEEKKNLFPEPHGGGIIPK